MRDPPGVGARAGEPADFNTRPRLGAAVDIVGVQGRRRRRSGVTTGKECGKPDKGESSSESPLSARVTRQVSLPSVRSFLTTAHPSASVTLAATAALIRFP